MNTHKVANEAAEWEDQEDGKDEVGPANMNTYTYIKPDGDIGGLRVPRLIADLMHMRQIE